VLYQTLAALYLKCQPPNFWSQRQYAWKPFVKAGECVKNLSYKGFNRMLWSCN